MRVENPLEIRRPRVATPARDAGNTASAEKASDVRLPRQRRFCGRQPHARSVSSPVLCRPLALSYVYLSQGSYVSFCPSLRMWRPRIPAAAEIPNVTAAARSSNAHVLRAK